MPYLQLVMPPLLAAAQLKPDVIVRDVAEGDDDEEEEEEDDGDVSLVLRAGSGWEVGARADPAGGWAACCRG
jgi:hypothetical protein